MSEKVIAPWPPRDGREWDVQCARCGSSCIFEECDYCGGEGYNESDDWQDDEDTLIPCDVCRQRGGHWACCSGEEWCEAHPNDGREATKRGTLEWFTFDRASRRGDGDPKPTGPGQPGDTKASTNLSREDGLAMNNEVFGDQLRAQLLADHCDDGVAFTADATDDRALLRLAQLIGSKELLYREPDGDYVVPFTAGDRKRLARILHTRART